MNARTLIVILALALLATPALARHDGSKTVSGADTSQGLGGQGGRGHHEPAKKQETAKLDAIYSQEVAAWSDFQTTGRIAGYREALDYSIDYHNAVHAARVAKTIGKHYKEKAPLSDFGQCCPYNDENNDGYNDGSPGDTGNTGNFSGKSGAVGSDDIGGIP